MKISIVEEVKNIVNTNEYNDELSIYYEAIEMNNILIEKGFAKKPRGYDIYSSLNQHLYSNNEAKNNNKNIF